MTVRLRATPHCLMMKCQGHYQKTYLEMGHTMDFWSAVKSVFGKYATFKGRACRSEYWYFYLFDIIVFLIAGIVDLTIFGPDVELVSSVWGLATLIPIIAVGVRRLHDIDRTGWWLLLSFIPLIGWIILIVWFCTRGTAGSNRFGNDPLA